MKHEDIDHTGLPGVTGVTEIADLPTAEGDTSLVLAPDGAGGVEFRAEAGGGGGVVPWYVPPLHGLAHVSYVTVAANWAFYLPCVIPADCTVTGAFVLLGVSSGDISVALYDAAGNRVATSGAVSAPSAGIPAGVAFTSPYAASAGRYYIGLSMSSATASFSIGGAVGPVAAARNHYQTSAHPCPSTMAPSGVTNYPVNVHLAVSGGFPSL